MFLSVGGCINDVLLRSIFSPAAVYQVIRAAVGGLQAILFPRLRLPQVFILMLLYLMGLRQAVMVLRRAVMAIRWAVMLLILSKDIIVANVC